MKKLIVLLLVCIAFLANTSYAQEQHPIDQFEENAIAKDWTTAGMNNATYQAMEMWEEEMNKYYNLLMNILDDDRKELLRVSQENWTSFKDAEFDVIDTIYPSMGTMWSNIRTSDMRGLVKERALTLKFYYEENLEHLEDMEEDIE
jgi:uncharacterized protein YecT (DUF1311 family)